MIHMETIKAPGNNKLVKDTVKDIYSVADKNSLQTRLFINPRCKINNQKDIDELVDIAREGFGTEMTEQDVRNHVLNTDILYLVKDIESDKNVAFSSYDLVNFGNDKILYLNGIVVRRSLQKSGLFYDINKRVLSIDDFDYIVMRTQNPVIYGATKKLVKNIYPAQEDVPKKIKDLASIIAMEHLHMKSFDPETFVGRGTYGVCLYDSIPHHKDTNAFFDKKLKLDYDKGDSVLIIGELK